MYTHVFLAAPVIASGPGRGDTEIEKCFDMSVVLSSVDDTLRAVGDIITSMETVGVLMAARTRASVAVGPGAGRSTARWLLDGHFFRTQGQAAAPDALHFALVRRLRVQPMAARMALPRDEWLATIAQDGRAARLASTPVTSPARQSSALPCWQVRGCPSAGREVTVLLPVPGPIISRLALR